MEKKTLTQLSVALGAIAILLIGLGWYSFSSFRDLSRKVEGLSTHIATLELETASTTAMIEGNIAKTKSDLSNALNEQKQNVGTIEQKLGTYQQQVGSITGTVSNLQKLSKTDPELLAKYSKVFFLSENYAPPRLIEVPDKYKYSETKHPTIHEGVMPHLLAMLGDAERDGIKIFVSSAYRSFDEQQALKGQYRVVYGTGTANSFSADQGYSEHQLGTAIDFITTGTGGALEGFEKTTAYNWLIANAYRSGFVISYPKENKFYVYEPWHWRYVGVKLATDLHNAGENFYDWDQRKIDEYLVHIFE